MLGIWSDNTAVVVGVRVGGWMMMLSCWESVYYHRPKISAETTGNSSFAGLIMDLAHFISSTASDGMRMMNDVGAMP